MTPDKLLETPSKRWRLYERENGSHYVLSPYGTKVEIEGAASQLFFVCAEGLGLLPNDLAGLCELAPPTSPTPETIALGEGR